MKKAVALFTIVILILGNMMTAFASPFSNYEYSSNNYNSLITDDKSEANAKKAPEAFTYSGVYSLATLNGLLCAFKDSADIAFDDGGNLYVLDSGNGRIAVIDTKTDTLKQIINFWSDGNGQSGNFASGTGMFIKNDKMYICLQNEGKILILNIASGTNTLIAEGIITSPDLSLVTDSFSFKPKSVAVDDSNRLYVISEGTFDGLIMLDTDSNFLGFMGANEISLTLWQKFWRSISTAEQVDSSEDTVPVEFYSMDIDGDGFIYTTSKGEEQENTVRRLNLIGNDVIKTGNHNIIGELSVLTDKGNPGTTSNLVDICVTNGGIYSCIDNARGRIFTYNNDGDMLFAFGGISAQKGGFSVPCAIAWNNNTIYVLDKGMGEVVRFSATDYGKAVLKAVDTQYNGQYGDSYEYWNTVLKMNPNNEIANRNVGKLKYDKADYRSAMAYFKMANDKKLYSKAYVKYRAEQIKRCLPNAVIVLAVIILCFMIVKAVLFIKKVKIDIEAFMLKLKD